LELYPEESEIIAEAHFKLSLALEFASVTVADDDGTGAKREEMDQSLRDEAVKEMELAIKSSKLKLQNKEVELATMASPEDNELARKSIQEMKEVIGDMEQRVSPYLLVPCVSCVSILLTICSLLTSEMIPLTPRACWALMLLPLAVSLGLLLASLLPRPRLVLRRPRRLPPILAASSARRTRRLPPRLLPQRPLLRLKLSLTASERPKSPLRSPRPRRPRWKLKTANIYCFSFGRALQGVKSRMEFGLSRTARYVMAWDGRDGTATLPWLTQARVKVYNYQQPFGA
jgi:hypothetical protein